MKHLPRAGGVGVCSATLLLRCAVSLGLTCGSVVGIAVAQGDARPARAARLESPIGPGAEPAAPWRLGLLPKQKPPATRFDVVELDGVRVLRVASPSSYGNLLRTFEPALPGELTLRWSWRVDRAPDADLRTREGDDVAMQVCVLYEWPLERLPLGDRLKLTTARAITGDALPTATICYVADKALATGTWLANAYTQRVRLLVVQGREAPLDRWSTHERDLQADFRRAFADEWRDGDSAPPVRAIGVGGNTDNTASDGLGYLRSIELR
jgi:hypothetical protein